MIVSAQNNRVTIVQNKLCSVLHTQWDKTFLGCAQLWYHMLVLLCLSSSCLAQWTLASFLISIILDAKHEKIVWRKPRFFFCLHMNIFQATVGRIFKNENEKKYLGCSRQVFIFSIQDYLLGY